jgi:hypothetical protein
MKGFNMNFKKLAAVASVGAVAVLTLSGCLRVEANVYLDSEGEISNVVTVVAASKEAPASLSGLGMGDMTLGGEPAGELTLESFKRDTIEQNPEASEYCVFSETDSEFLATCETPLSESPTLNPDGVTIAVDGSTITVTQETDSAGEGMESLAAMKMFGVSLTSKYHFPGDVESFSGAGVSVDSSAPNVAVIDMLATDGSPVVITASNGETGGSALWWIIGTSGIVVLLGLAAFFLANGNKGRKSESVKDVNEVVVTNTEKDSFDPLGDIVTTESKVTVENVDTPEDKPASN